MIKIPKDIRDIHILFVNSGKDLYLVGGCVRDFLLDVEPHDYDLVTNALPDEIKKILRFYRTDLQGAKFGVIRVFTETFPLGLEIASYRKDISRGRDNKGDDQKVELGTHLTLKDDVSRRDITVNGIAFDIENQKIIDYVGGVEDLTTNKIIRTIGHPFDRFNEDRLRILRSIRFSARFGFKLDEKIKTYLLQDNRLRGVGPKDDISQERIVEEFFKMFNHAKSSNSPEMMHKYLEMLDIFGLIKEMFPFYINSNFYKYRSNHIVYPYIKHTLNEIVFLASLFEGCDIKTISKVMIEYKFESSLANKVRFLLTFRELIEDDTKAYDLLLEKNKTHVDIDTIREYFTLYELNKEKCEKFIKYCEKGISTSGDDLEKEGYKPGKELGDEKKRREILIYQSL